MVNKLEKTIDCLSFTFRLGDDNPDWPNGVVRTDFGVSSETHVIP